MTKNHEREAFNIEVDRTINSLGACDDEFNHWHLDHGNLRSLFHRIWQAALSHAVPEGCVVVPRDLSATMVEAGENLGFTKLDCYELYNAMLAAYVAGKE